MFELAHGLALAGIVVTLLAVWVSRVHRTLPASAGGDDSRGDPAVLALVAEPYDSVGDAYRRLWRLERLFRDRDDRRAVFLTVYAPVTREVATGIERDEFENPAWVADYLVTFANYYREALYRFETGDTDSLPGAWRRFFEATATTDALVLQCAVLGINAHVNYDLALALREVGVDSDRAARYRDHRRINAILWRLVDETLDTLAGRYAPGIATLAELTGPLGEWLWFLGLAAGREGAWWIALALSESPWRPLRAVVQSTMDYFATAVAYAVLLPNGHPTALAVLQRWELLATSNRRE